MEYLIENAKQDDITIKVDTALFTVEKNNPVLKGALPDNYYSRLNLDVKQASFAFGYHQQHQHSQGQRAGIVGRVYEYFLSKFALAEGKAKVNSILQKHRQSHC